MAEPLIYQVKQHSKISSVIEKCDEYIASENFDKIILVGESKSVNKAISISQILQKKYPNLTETTNLELSDKMKNEPKLSLILTKAKI